MNGPFGLPGGGSIQRYEAREVLGYLPRGWIDGLTLSNDTTDATNDVGIAAGTARSTARIVDGTASTLTRDQMDLELPVGIIKQIDTAWAPENYDPDGYPGSSDATGRSGGRSSSALSNTTWHYLLVGGGGLQTDVLIHDSATQSSILAEMQKIGGYTAYRWLGPIIRSSGAILAFFQNDDEFLWKDTVVEINNTAPGGTTGNTLTLTGVPTGIIATALLNQNTGGATQVRFSALSQTDVAPSGTNALTNAAQNAPGQIRVRTNASAQIRYRLNVNAAISIGTEGFVISRGRNS